MLELQSGLQSARLSELLFLKTKNDQYTKYGWDFDQVFKEMKDFKFYTFFGKFGVIKEFVKDYGEQMNAKENKDVAVSHKIGFDAAEFLFFEFF